MRIVDTRGMRCPAPLIATKRALKESDGKEGFQICVDTKTSFNNISRFLKDNETVFSSEESDGLFTIIVSPGNSTQKNSIADLTGIHTSPIPHFAKGNYMIAFTSDKMGDGDENLSRILIENFIKAIKDLDTLPNKMVFYNRGVFLGSEDSPVVGHLREIERMGVDLLLCATCVDFYSLRDRIKIGMLSNMYEIAGLMVSAGKVIKP